MYAVSGAGWAVLVAFIMNCMRVVAAFVMVVVVVVVVGGLHSTFLFAFLFSGT
jgi:hypothetical protein